MPAPSKTSNNLKPDAKSVSIAVLNARLAHAIDLTLQVAAKKSQLAAHSTDISSEKDHLKELIARYAPVANAVRADIEEADWAGDRDTADMLTACSRAFGKALWSLEAHTP